MPMARWSRPERSRSHQLSDSSTASLQTDDSFDFHQQFGTTETCDNGFDWARDAGVHKSIARGRTVAFIHDVHADVGEARDGGPRGRRGRQTCALRDQRVEIDERFVELRADGFRVHRVFAAYAGGPTNEQPLRVSLERRA